MEFQKPVPANVVGNKLNLYGERDAINAMTCINPPMGCGRSISQEEFMSYDALTQKEYTQSGWCTTCQDAFFNNPPKEECSEGCKHGDDGEEIPDDCMCTCDRPCCEVDVGVGILTCQSQHCRVHGKNAPKEDNDK